MKVLLSAAALAGLAFFSLHAASGQVEAKMLKVTIAVDGMMKSKSGAI